MGSQGYAYIVEASNQVFNKKHFCVNERKTRLMVRASCKAVFEFRGQPVKKNFRCQRQSIFCSLKCLGWCRQVISSLYQVYQLQFGRLQEKGQVQFLVISNENDGKKSKTLVWISVARYFRRLEEIRI